MKIQVIKKLVLMGLTNNTKIGRTNKECNVFKNTWQFGL